MAARMARTIGPVTATSASWKVMARAWRTTRAPILTSFNCKLVSDHRRRSGRKTLDQLAKSGDLDVSRQATWGMSEKGDALMSFWLSMRAGRVAGKAAKKYCDVMGQMPSEYRAKSMQEAAYYGLDEYNIAFRFLLIELQSEIINVDGETEYRHKDLCNSVTNRILQELKKMSRERSINTADLDELGKAVSRLEKY
jgi:hypothetical protein